MEPDDAHPLGAVADAATAPVTPEPPGNGGRVPAHEGRAAPGASLDPIGLAALIDGWSPKQPCQYVEIAAGTADAAAPPHRLATVERDGTIRPVGDPAAVVLTASGAVGLGLAAADDAPATEPQLDAAARATARLQDHFGLPVGAFRLAGRWPAGAFPRLANAIRARRDGSPFGDAPDTQELHMSQDTPSPTARGAGLDPATLNALRPHLVALWNGGFSHGGAFQSDQADVDRIFDDALPRRLAALPDGQALPIVIYAHGGLVDEAAGLQIAANQVPWWNANGCYPLQFLWKTGLFESLEKIVGLQRDLSFRPTDITDGLIEVAAHVVGVDIWGNMKNAAAAAFEPGAAGTLVAERLVGFARAHPDRVRLHAVGHSAGSIFNAHLLRRLDALDAPPLETVSFLAPAITVDAYLRLFDPLIPRRARSLRIFTMSKDYERRDTVTRLYHKSLLYLIRNALEPRVGEPVLGLEESLRGDPRLVQRFGLAGTASPTGSVVWSVTSAKAGAEASTSTTHGGFDNDVPTMNSVARRILGIPDATALPRDFPADTELRGAAAPQIQLLPSQPAAPPPEPGPAPPRPDGRARRVALCVGIDAYKAPNTLNGSVADSNSWADGLQRLGFAVDKLQDAAANHKTIMGRLAAMVDGSRAGDVLVFQYAGHGAQVPDLDGDETGADGQPGSDQAICPIDFETGDLIIDDDIRAVLDRLPAGVHMTCFMDSCHSGTATRFLVGRQPARPNTRARYIDLSGAVVERYVAKRMAVNQARALTGSRRGAGTPDAMRWVAFAACQSDESAWETDGHGDFTRRATPLLANGAGLTNGAFQDRLLQAFGAQRRQNPRLDCRAQDKDAPFLPGAAGPGAAGADGAVAPPAGEAAPPAPPPDETRAGQPAIDRRTEVADLLAAIAKVLR